MSSTILWTPHPQKESPLIIPAEGRFSVSSAGPSKSKVVSTNGITKRSRVFAKGSPLDVPVVVLTLVSVGNMLGPELPTLRKAPRALGVVAPVW